MLASRRTLLASAALLPVAGCTALGIGPVTPTPLTPQQQITAWLQALAAGAAALPGVLSTIPGLTPAALAQDMAILTAVNGAANAIASTTSTATSATIAAWVEEIATVVADILPFVPGGSAIAPIVGALAGLAPVILAALGITAAPHPRHAGAPLAQVKPLALQPALAVLQALPQPVK